MHVTEQGLGAEFEARRSRDYKRGRRGEKDQDSAPSTRTRKQVIKWPERNKLLASRPGKRELFEAAETLVNEGLAVARRPVSNSQRSRLGRRRR